METGALYWQAVWSAVFAVVCDGQHQYHLVLTDTNRRHILTMAEASSSLVCLMT